jgi:hypothetical protein
MVGSYPGVFAAVLNRQEAAKAREPIPESKEYYAKGEG